MRVIRQWYTCSSPTVKMLMAISITSLLFVSHKIYLAPYLKKRRYQNNETFANIILEQEEIVQESLENN